MKADTMQDITESILHRISKLKKEQSQVIYATVSDAILASDCIQCGQCERACPQQLRVMEYLKHNETAQSVAPTIPPEKR